MIQEILSVIYILPTALIITLIITGTGFAAAHILFWIYEAVEDSLFLEDLIDWFQYRRTIRTFKQIDKIAQKEGWVNVCGVKSLSK